MKKLLDIKGFSNKHDIRNSVVKIFLFSSFLIFNSPLNSLAQPLEEGKASYYARKFTGRRTANGEFFHHDSMTCAHKHYAFGTLLKVSNPANGKVVIVRVNDRGPFVRGRIIDLSWKAARTLGIVNQGVAMVKVVPLNLTFIPFRSDDTIELPEFNFETTFERPFSMKPEWQEFKDINNKE